MRSTNRRTITTALIAAVMALTACTATDTGGAGGSGVNTGSGTTSTETSASDSTVGSSTGDSDGTAGTPSYPSSTSPQSTPPTTETDHHPVDALTLTGPVEAATVPDMQPVLTNPQPQLPATVTDTNGAAITIEQADRVIALDLYGTLVDTIIGLGLQDRLVGRGVSDTQDALADLPVVSNGGIELNVEAVLSLSPDVVLTNSTIGSDTVYRQLESAGVTVVRFANDPAIADIDADITAVAAVFGMTDQTQPLLEQVNQQLAAARETISGLAALTPREPRALVLYIRGSGIFFIFGNDYGTSDVLAELRLADVAAFNGIDNLVPASPEALAKLDPEIILTMSDGMESAGGVDALLGRPGMSATTAGANRRVISADDAQLLSYGPRTPANLVAVAEAIYEPAG